MTQKQMLYAQADENNQKYIVGRLYNRIDPMLAALIILRPSQITINNSQRKSMPWNTK
jgi:hypothetical protein